MLSRRSEFGSEENALSRALAEARARGRAILDLTVSNPTAVGLSPPASVLAPLLGAPGIARYRPSPLGLDEAREAVAAVAGVPPAQVVLTASTSEAYGLLFKLLCDPGDAVLVPAPSYPLLDVLARLEAIETRPYPLRYDGEWHVDVAGLRGVIDERARAVVAVSPNNPTGSYLKADELESLLALGLPAIVDEVFHPFALEGEPPPRRAPSRGLLFRLSGLSKLVALPQMKLGWIAVEGEPALVQESLRRLEHLNDAYLSASTPVQEATAGFLALAGEVQRRIVARCRANLGALDAAIAACPALSRTRVEGGWYAVLRLPRVRSEEAFVLGLLEEGVLAQPGWFYDFPDEAHLVLSLLTPEDEFAEGARRIGAHVAAALAG